MSKRSFESGSKGWRATLAAMGKTSPFVMTMAFLGLLLGVGSAQIWRNVDVHSVSSPPAMASVHVSASHTKIDAATDVKAAAPAAVAPYDIASVERTARVRWAKVNPAMARATATVGSYAEVAHLVNKSDWNTLSADHRAMIRHMMMDARAGKADAMPCFAPGTDLATVRAFDAVNSGLQFFRAGSYWSRTASGSHAVGAPMTLTWSVVPDGTTVPNSNGSAASNLKARLNGIYGSEANWRPLFRQIFARYSQLSGITYVEETADDGSPSPDNAGVLGVRGDVRIGGTKIDGDYGVLAFNYFPDLGDMVIDTADVAYDDTSSNSRLFRNVLGHEHGHGLGFAHTCPLDQTKLMEPFLSTRFDGPQADDVQNLQRGYGDPNEPNNNQTAATDLGTLGNGTTSLTNVSIQNTGDQDFYRFATSGAKKLSVTLRPLGGTYLEGPQNPDGSCTAGTPFAAGSQRNLNFTVFNAAGTALVTVDDNGTGAAENLSNFVLNNNAGPFAVRVAGDAVDLIQLYSLEVTLGDAGPLLDLNGPSAGTGFTANFTEDGGAVPIVDSAALTVGNTNNANLASATITLSNRPDGTSETLTVMPSGAITADKIAYANGVLTITANASIADYQAVLRSAKYNNLSQSPDTTSRTVNFVIKDNGGNSATAAATVQVTAVNDAPVANSQSVTTNEDTPFNITLSATDIDSPTLSYTILTNPANGILSGSGADRSYAPNANFNGSDSFSFRVSDGTTNSNTAVVTITVTPVNDAPINTVPGAQAIDLNTTLIFSAGTGNAISVADGDAGSGTIEQTLSAANGTLTLGSTAGLFFSTGDGTDDRTMTYRGTLAAINAALDGLTYTPQVLAAGFSDRDTLNVTTNDLGNAGGAAQTDTDSVTIAVGNQNVLSIDNAPPLREGDSGQAKAATFTVTLSQAVAGEVRVSYQTQSGTATEGSDFVRTTGELIFAPGDISKTIAVPVIGDTLVETDEQFTVRLSNPQNASLNPQTFVGTGSIIEDDVALLTLVITPTTFSEAAGANAATGTVSRNTDNTAALTVSLQSGVPSKVTVPASVVIPAGQNSASFTLNAIDDKVIDSDVNVTITARSNGFASTPVNITVTNDDLPPPPNQNPTANPQKLTTNEDTPLTIVPTGSDPEGMPLSFRVSAPPTYRPTGSDSFSPNFEGNLRQDGANFVFTPPQDFNGDVKFSVIASDGQDDSAPAQIAVQVLAVNDAPVAQSDKIRFVLQNSNAAPLSITLKASDVDGDALTYIVGQDLPGAEGRSIGPVYGKITGTAPNLIYTPPAGYRGRDVFTFYVSDGKTTSLRARIDILVTGSRGVVAANDSFTLDINGINDDGDLLPQAEGITFSNGTFRIAAPGVTANDRDPAGGALLVRLAQTTRSGRLVLRNDGSFDYTPNPNFVGTDFFAYSVGNAISQDEGRVRLIVRDRRAPDLNFDAPADDLVTFHVTEIRGRVRDGNAGLQSISLLWRRFDGKFWNGSSWVAAETPLPLVVQGDNWRYNGSLPQPGDDPATSLIDGDYDLQVTAIDKAGNTSRVVNSITIDRNAPDATATSPVRFSSGVATSTPNAIVLNFTGALDVASARNTANYRVLIDGVAVAVPQATYANNSVKLNGLSFEAGQIVEVQIKGLRDTSGRRLPNSAARLLSS